MAGRSRNERAPNHTLIGALALCLCAPATAAWARDTGQEAGRVHVFSVAPGRLADALLALADQADISIAVNDAALASLRVQGLKGRYSLSAALRRLLAGSGYTFRFVDRSTVRLEKIHRASPVHPQKRKRQDRQAAVVRAPTVKGPPIVVIATKRHLSLTDDPESVTVLSPSRSDLARGGGAGTGFLLARLPQITATNLGPGRNKLFIRGIADSSFNGASQSTVGQYLGEFRLIYSAPDPDLALYDVSQVDVLEGPQGTLYGAAALGGIIRVDPVAPQLDHPAFEASSALSLTHRGSAGADGALVANVPLVRGSLGLRALVYGISQGGYIDDTERDLKNINRNNEFGGRLTLRWHPSEDWDAQLMVVGQDIASRDGQYTLAGQPQLTRRSAIAQPFDNDYRLAGITVKHDAGPVHIVSATGYVVQTIRSVYDATPDTADATLQVFREGEHVHLLSHETRASGSWGRDGTWLLGLGIVDSRNHVLRQLGAMQDTPVISDTVNTTFDGALFGEAGVPVTGRIVLTLGGRLSYVRQSSAYAGVLRETRHGPVRKQTRVLPTAALSWKTPGGLLLYARYQQGYRPGGLELTGTGAGESATSMRQSAQRFASDRIQTVELGLRFGMRGQPALSGSIVASATRWHDIQADLIDTDGLPYVANIGSGRVRNLAANLTWRPAKALSIEATGFLNSSDLSDPAPGYGALTDRDLPNVADDGWRVSGRFSRPLGGMRLTLDAALRYVGRSKLAVSAPFALHQGRYYDASAGVRVEMGRWGISLDATNLLDTRGNTFAFGNPFSAAAGLQQTPQRPRTLRLGVDTRF